MALSIRTKQFSPVFRALACLIVVGAALLATLAWQYSSVLGNLQLFAVHENPTFSGKPFASFPFLYLLSIPAFYWCWRHSRPLAILLIAGFAVTLVAYGFLRIISDFFERYVFFLAFFPQVLIAAVLADNLEKLITARRQKLSDLSVGVLGRSFIVVFPVAFFAVLIASAAKRSYSVISLSPNSRAVFENYFPRLVGAVSQSDIVAACPITHETLFLFSKTGARFVLPSSSYRGQTRVTRQTDLNALFHDGSSRNSVDAIIQRYGITKTLVRSDCSVPPLLNSFFPEVVVREGRWTIYSVAGTTPAER